MMIFFLILVIVACVGIAFFILVQNPKGGGLAGNIAGFNTQFMGVKQTTDVLEKGTWVLAFVIAMLCLCSAFFIPKSTTIQTPGGGAKPTSTQPTQTPLPPAQK